MDVLSKQTFTNLIEIYSMKTLPFLLTLLMFNFVMLVSCKKPNTADYTIDATQNTQLLSNYFSASTSGVISVGDEIKFILNKPLHHKVSMEHLSKAVRLKPETKGIITINNAMMLTFKPLELLQPNTKYTVMINLPVLDSVRFKNAIKTEFHTIKQDFKIQKEGIKINKDGTVSIQVGVTLADKVNEVDLRSCFATDCPEIELIERGTNEYEIEFVYGHKLKNTSFIKFDGANIGNNKKSMITVFDTYPKEFGLIFSHYDEKDKIWYGYFSKPLRQKADLSGVLKVENTDASFAINGNELKVFCGQYRNVRDLDIMIGKEIMSSDGEEMVADFSYHITQEVDFPSAAFVGWGNYFPSKGNGKIAIKTRALKAIRVVVVEIKQQNVLQYLTWQSLSNPSYSSLRMYGKPVYDQIVKLNIDKVDESGWVIHGIDLSNRMERNPGSIYHITLDFGPEHTTLDCTVDLSFKYVRKNIPPSSYYGDNQKEYGHYDNEYDHYNSYDKDYEDYDYDNSGQPCTIDYYLSRKAISHIFVCNDYSVIAKRSDNDYNIAISDLFDLSHKSGINLSLYDKQGNKLKTSKTNELGFCKLTGVQYEGAVLKMEEGNNISYMTLDENEANSLTEFDVSSDRKETDSSFFVYTDRNIWRPGDSIYVDIMVNKDFCSLPKGLPISLTFLNPDNTTIDKQKSVLDIDQNLIYSFALYTELSAKTGQYRCAIQIGSQTITKAIRIESIRPNVAEVIYAFDKQEGNTIYSNQVSGTIAAKYLTGFEIKAGKITSEVVCHKINNPFPTFKGFRFDTYIKNQSGSQLFKLLDVTTDDNGQATFANDEDFKMYNSMLLMSLETEMMLPGGGINKEGTSYIVSPFASYVGTKASEGSGWQGSFTFGDDIEVEIVNVTDRGKLFTTKNTINYSLQQCVESWWIDKYSLQSNGNYIDGKFWQDIKEDALDIVGKGVIKFAKQSLQKGAYKLTVEDGMSGHTSQILFSVYDGFEKIPGTQPYMVNFTTDKDVYDVGQNIKIILPEIAGAKALISIEKGNKVIEQSWYMLTSKKNIVTIATDERWTHNVYIHVTIMQPYDQKKNDLPLRMYGIKYIKMDAKARQLNPIVTIPHSLESNTQYDIAVKEKDGREMQYTLALVDEGLLSMTEFATPDAYKHFNGKYPLLVHTWDSYSFLIQHFAGKFAGIISIGGDGAYRPDGVVNVSRFKPIAMHFGPFALKKGGSNIHKINIPNYIGKMRLMVVACNDISFGRLEQYVTVQNPLMVMTNMPRSLNVSDKLQLPINILQGDKNINNAMLHIKANPAMISGLNKKQQIDFGNDSQVLQVFDVEVLDKVGKMEVEVTASKGNTSMKEKTEIAIQYPNGFESKITTIEICPHSTEKCIIDPIGFKESFTSELTVSGMKIPSFTAYASELIEYPYGCLEQTTSAGFGQLYLDKIVTLTPQEEKERIFNIYATIQRLTMYQQSSGAFNYWDSGMYHEWSDLYAGNFIIEIKQLGHPVNTDDIFNKWSSYHASIANQWTSTVGTDNDQKDVENFLQAYRLFLLAKASKPTKSAMNKFVLQCKSKQPMVWWLMAGAFKHCGYGSKADEMVRKAIACNTESNSDMYYDTFGEKPRDLAIIIEVLSLFDDQSTLMDLNYNNMVDLLNKKPAVNTQTKGYVFVATHKYFGRALDISKVSNFSVKTAEGITNYQLNYFTSQNIKISHNSMGKTVSITNENDVPIYVTRMDKFIDKNIAKNPINNAIKMNCTFQNITTGDDDLSCVHIGDDIFIKIDIQNPKNTEIRDLALNVKMPSGWELINPALYETSNQKTNVNIEHQDYRDDRVYTFFNINSNDKESFVFKAKATFSGDFFFPAIICESMYDASIMARSKNTRTLVHRRI